LENDLHLQGKEVASVAGGAEHTIAITTAGEVGISLRRVLAHFLSHAL
jgi:hypothetical protein